ncbi:hypothetical protein BKM31_44295 [[Actinomadura] parvosata subsp. kistnae]|uniref:Uncharacterized protein n=1 Tax=[Actinomadura] parvosata subsp. kistnae TaxID=1909395 RepID=A0A1V0ABJ0_9ACTN|nr:hypothetical protein BKM31_44295 [Nonomuraea sp. ATCC 55076]
MLQVPKCFCLYLLQGLRETRTASHLDAKWLESIAHFEDLRNIPAEFAGRMCYVIGLEFSVDPRSSAVEVA